MMTWESTNYRTWLVMPSLFNQTFGAQPCSIVPMSGLVFLIDSIPIRMGEIEFIAIELCVCGLCRKKASVCSTIKKKHMIFAIGGWLNEYKNPDIYMYWKL